MKKAKEQLLRAAAREKVMQERGASSLPKGKFPPPTDLSEAFRLRGRVPSSNPTKIEESAAREKELEEKKGEDGKGEGLDLGMPSPGLGLGSVVAPAVWRQIEESIRPATSRGQLFAPNISREKVDEGISRVGQKLKDLAQPKAEYDFLNNQLNSLKELEAYGSSPDQPTQSLSGNVVVDRNTLGGEERDPQKAMALIAQYKQQGLITDITDSTVTFDMSKVRAQRKNVESLIEPLRGVQKRAELLEAVKQRLDGYVTEGIYGSEQEEE